MSKKLLLDSYANRSETLIDETHLTGKFVTHCVEDCEPYIREAMMLSEQTPGEHFRLAAIVPHFVYAKALREGWANDNQAWARWCNDIDNQKLRVARGHV